MWVRGAMDLCYQGCSETKNYVRQILALKVSKLGDCGDVKQGDLTALLYNKNIILQQFFRPVYLKKATWCDARCSAATSAAGHGVLWLNYWLRNPATVADQSCQRFMWRSCLRRVLLRNGTFLSGGQRARDRWCGNRAMTKVNSYKRKTTNHLWKRTKAMITGIVQLPHLITLLTIVVTFRRDIIAMHVGTLLLWIAAIRVLQSNYPVIYQNCSTQSS
jgi:hypothetical protein